MLCLDIDGGNRYAGGWGKDKSLEEGETAGSLCQYRSLGFGYLGKVSECMIAEQHRGKKSL